MQRQNSSQANLKVAVCEVLSVNASLQNLLLETLGINIYQPFCFNNMSLLETFFQELRTHISKMAFVQEAGTFLSLISQVQNETSIWNLFLMAPDIINGATTVRDMVDTLHNRKRLFMKRENSPQMILNMTSWLSTLSCSEQDKNNLTINYICEQPVSWKKNLILFAKMKEVLRNLLALDFAYEDFKTGYFSKDYKRNTKSQNSLKKMPLFDLKENIHNLNMSIRNIMFLNNIIFKARKAWQTVKMRTVHKFSFLPEKYRRYLTSVEEVPSLLLNFLLKPATTDNFPEKLLVLQKIFSIITNSRTNHNYLLISSLTNLMQKIQSSINESQWNEFNTYWHIVEKLRSAKWSDTDILMYRQILDILHDSLYVNHDNFGLPLKIELEQMIKFVNHLLKKYDAGSIKGTNVSMVLNTILKSLQVLEDLEKKYISEFIIVNPLMNTNYKSVQKLFQTIKKGIEILSDPSQIEAFNVNKTDTLFRFSQALPLLDLYITPVWHNSSIQAKVLQLLYLAPSLLQMRNIQADNSFSDCTVKDFHLIAIEVFFNNATLKEALRESKCNFLFSSLDFENRTTYHYMFTQLFQLTIKNLKSTSLFETVQGNKKKHFPGNETEYYIQNFIDKLINWSELAVFSKLLRDFAHVNIPVNEATQRNKEESSIPSTSNFSQIWIMLSKWYHTETENARYGLEIMGKVLDHNKSDPEIFNISISTLNHLDLLKELKANPDPNLLSKRTELQYKFEHIRHPFLMVAETLLNKTFWKEWVQAQSPSNLIAQFLFSEFVHVFLKTSHNSNFSSYFICIMNVFQEPDNELSGNCTLPPKIRELKGVLFNSQNTYATVPEVLMLKLTHLQNLTSLLCDFESIGWLQQTCQLPDVSFAELLQENVSQLKYFRDNYKHISALNSIMNITKITPHSRKQDMIIDLFRNADGLKNDLRNIVGLSTKSINAFTEMPLSENKTQLESCNTDTGDVKLEIIAKQFCKFSFAERTYKSYLLGITFLRYLDVYKFIYKMLFPKEFQIPVDKALEFLKNMDHLRMQLVSNVHPLLDAIHSLKKLRMTRHAPLSKALFEASNLTINSRMLKTISKTFCNHEITPLFFESLLPDFEQQNVHHSSADEDEHIQHIMKKYSIPSDTSKFGS
ncbi:hypothetical protein Chor_015708 [Crotalus horridus]